MLAEPLAPIRAVHDDELSEFLESLGVLDDFESGRISCKFCGDVISEDNLLAIFPANNSIHFVCDKGSCQNDMSDLNLNE